MITVQRMKKTLLTIAIICGGAVLLVLLLIETVLLVHLRPSDMAILSVDVSTSTITLVGDIGASAVWYYDHTVHYRDGALFITVTGNQVVKLPQSTSVPFTIAIPNTYGPIKTIYLEGRGGEEDRMIWPENPTQRKSPQVEDLVPVVPGGGATSQ